jgi:type I restriction enzyme, S subunit
MSSETSMGAGFAGLDGLCKAEVWALDAAKVRERPNRMETIFYGSDGYQALEALRKSDLELTTVGKLARVIWFGPFARKYVEHPEHGLPFLTSSTMMEARPRPSKLVSIKHTKNLTALQVRKDYILVSCSGTVGNVALCTEDVDGWACSQDAIRVVARDPIDLGPLYCYLQSALGQFLLKRSQTGSVVRHLYEADVANLPSPKLPLELRRDLTERIRKVSALRVEANRLLDEAEQMVQEQLELPSVDSFGAEAVNDSLNNAALFCVSSSTTGVGVAKRQRCRLDATAHEPSAAALADFLLKLENSGSLSAFCPRIWRSSLRQRSYVEDAEFGVPLLNGKHLSLLRFGDLRLLSKLHTRNWKSELVEDGYVLVTCGGTIGRTIYVHRNVTGYAVSEDVIRVVPAGDRVAPGYVYAFLASQYGQTLVLAQQYGSVQKKLRDFQVSDLAFAVPADKGWSIHEMVALAFEKRASAYEIEDSAFSDFVISLQERSASVVRA